MSVFSYLLNRENCEESPYYKGRYLVAANVVRNAERGLELPYEVAEVIFQDTRYALKIQAWLCQQREQFPNWIVLSDGTLTRPRRAPIPFPKKPPQSVRLTPKRVIRLRITFADAA